MAYKQSYEHLCGWAADILVSLDIIDSGLLGVVARTSSARWQAVACVLAHVGEEALISIERIGQPVLCDEVIALHPVARDLRKLPTPLLLKRYVPGADEVLRLSLALTEGTQSPDYYRDLARQRGLGIEKCLTRVATGSHQDETEIVASKEALT